MGGTNQYSDEFIYVEKIIWVIWAVILFVALSGLYPANKLYTSTRRTAKTAFCIVTGMAAVSPLLFFAYDRLRLLRAHELIRNNPSVLHDNMPLLPADQLPYAYALGAAIAALLYWLIYAWHCRTSAP